MKDQLTYSQCFTFGEGLVRRVISYWSRESSPPILGCKEQLGCLATIDIKKTY